MRWRLQLSLLLADLLTLATRIMLAIIIIATTAGMLWLLETWPRGSEPGLPTCSNPPSGRGIAMASPGAAVGFGTNSELQTGRLTERFIGSITAMPRRRMSVLWSFGRIMSAS